MKTYAYLAINEFNDGFICEAYNKKQMKQAGMNMKLGWVRYATYDAALNELQCCNIQLKIASNVTNFCF